MLTIMNYHKLTRIAVAGICLAWLTEIRAGEVLNFEVNFRGAIPEMGDLGMSGKGRIEWDTRGSEAKFGKVTFSAFEYSGSISFIKQTPFSCSFAQTNNDQPVFLLIDSHETVTNKMDAAKLNQQYQYAYYALEAMSIVSSYNGTNVVYPEYVIVTPEKYKLKRSEMTDILAPKVYGTVIIETNGNHVLTSLNISEATIEFFLRVFDANNHVLNSTDFSVDKKYYSANHSTNDWAGHFQIHIPDDATYDYLFKSIKHVD
jgi:hypothetical protein